MVLVLECGKGSGKGGGGCQLIGTVRFNSLSLDKCHGFIYSTQEGTQPREKKSTGGIRHMRVMTNWRNELIDWGVLLPRTFVTLQFQTYQNNIKDVAECFERISVPGRRAR